MKKIFAIVFLLIIGWMPANANVQADNNIDRKPPYERRMDRQQHEKAFEQRLGLTDEQKTQARALRKEGFEKMKPVMEQIKAKRDEAQSIKQSNMALSDQQVKLIEIDKEVKTLEKQAHEIRMSDMKAFESILTADQKKTLNEMKKEGRENFKRNHPNGRLPMPPSKTNDREND